MICFQKGGGLRTLLMQVLYNVILSEICIFFNRNQHIIPKKTGQHKLQMIK